jgi:hypothetical protein
MDAAQKAGVEKKIVAVLLLVFAGTGVRALKAAGLLGGARPAPRPALPAGREAASPKSLSTVEALEEKALAPIPETPAPEIAGTPLYTAQGLRDPMASLLPQPPVELPNPAWGGATEPPPLPDLRLQGLVWGGDEPQAIINNRVYRVGESIDGATIVAIDRGQVTVEHFGRSVVFQTGSAGQP